MSFPTPWGAYIAGHSRNSATSLYDFTGNGRDATMNSISTGSESGAGASASIPFISGTKSSSITWPANSVPTTFTICSITRYATNGSNQSRIFDGNGLNWLHGHISTVAGHAYGLRGVAHYNAWKTLIVNYDGTASSSSTTSQADWLCMCGTNGTTHHTTAGNNIIANGTNVGTSTGGTGGTQLTINAGSQTTEHSDFKFNTVLIWASELTVAQMNSISEALNTYLTTGSIAYPWIAIPPTPPVISYANVFSNGSAIVSFSQTASTPAVSSYYYSTNGGSSFTNVVQTTSPIVITGLNVNTSYALSLMASSTGGNSTMANVTVGNAPVITSITPKNLALTVAFNPSSGGTATNYLYSIDGGQTFGNSVVTTTSPLQITNLTAGQSYSVAIKAAGTNWVSSNSSVTASTQPYNFGNVPVITGVVPLINALSVSFSLSTGAYDTPTYYYSYLGNTASNYNLLSPTPTVSPNTFVINNLSSQANIVILAINGAGNLYSTVVSQTPYSTGTRPNIISVAPQANALNVSFTGSQNANPTPYYYYSVNGSALANTGLNATGSVVIPGLTTYGNYAVQIVAVSSAGNISSNIAYGLPYVLGSALTVNNSGLAMNYRFNTDLLDYATGTGVSAYNVSGTVSYVAGTGANTILGNGSAFFGPTNSAGFQPVQNITVGTNGATAATWIKLVSIVPTTQKYTRIFEFVNSVSGLPFFSLQFDRNFTNIAVAFESGIVFSCPFVADTNWHHYSVIIGSSGNFTLYIDNIVRLQNTYGNYSATFANQINSCYVGGTNAGLPYSI